jgi:hypothetical protein
MTLSQLMSICILGFSPSIFSWNRSAIAALRLRSELVGIRFAAKATRDVRFRGDTGDIRARRGGRC